MNSRGPESLLSIFAGCLLYALMTGAVAAVSAGGLCSVACWLGWASGPDVPAAMLWSGLSAVACVVGFGVWAWRQA